MNQFWKKDNFKKLINGAVLIPGLVFYGVVKLLRPFFKIRVGILIYNRICHLGPNTEMYLRRLARDGKPKREIHIFLSGRPANRQLMTMIKRKIPVFENRVLLKIFTTLRRHTPASDIWIDLPFETNEYEEFNNIAPQIFVYTQAEEERGIELLKKMGISREKEFVCFHARDKAYLQTVPLSNPQDSWSYHDFRDCEIENYLPAAEYLAEQGIYALRRGAIVEKKISSKHKRVIDYATQ